MLRHFRAAGGIALRGRLTGQRRRRRQRRIGRQLSCLERVEEQRAGQAWTCRRLERCIKDRRHLNVVQRVVPHAGLRCRRREKERNLHCVGMKVATQLGRDRPRRHQLRKEEDDGGLPLLVPWKSSRCLVQTMLCMNLMAW